ncbi:MAG: hypothetical protein ACRD0P_25825, partial [Stackebrandtia sp.]
MGLLVLTASAARAVAHLTGEHQTVALAVATTAFVAAVTVLFVVRRKVFGPRARRWAIACSTVAASWLATVTAVGISWDAIGLLTALGYGLALPWWRRHRLPNTPPPIEYEPVLAPAMDTYDVRWATYLGETKDSPLAGTWLTSHEEIDSGHRYVLQLRPGKHSLQTVLGILPMLRTGLKLMPGQDLIVERHPVLDESCLNLTIVTRSQVLTAESIPWPGNTYDPETGAISLGPFVDGDGVAKWRLYGRNSIYGGFICGAPDSGKSRMMESIALSAAAIGTVIWFGDPQGGASSPWLAKHADHYASGVGAIEKMLAEALLVKDLRQAENALYDWEGFTHSPERPGLLIFIDECHSAFADSAIQEMAIELAREGRKCGIAIVAASQVATLDAFGKGQEADALRSCITAGNLVVLRTTSNNTKNVLPGVDVNPTKFPAIPGYAYLVDTTHKRRSAPLRGYYLADADRDTLADAITWAPLDTGASNAAGPGYLRRRAQADADRKALAHR